MNNRYNGPDDRDLSGWNTGLEAMCAHLNCVRRRLLSLGEPVTATTIAVEIAGMYATWDGYSEAPAYCATIFGYYHYVRKLMPDLPPGDLDALRMLEQVGTDAMPGTELMGWELNYYD